MVLLLVHILLIHRTVLWCKNNSRNLKSAANSLRFAARLQKMNFSFLQNAAIQLGRCTCRLAYRLFYAEWHVFSAQKAASGKTPNVLSGWL
jgi:glycine cleavage system protein P-like pyridoxal-binding family